jgi:hypothetical protein
MSNTKQRSILAKVEVTEGTDSTPVVATNAILCGSITVTPVGGSTADRQLAYPDFSATPKVHVNKFVQVQFDVELAGAGAAGSAPKYGVLLRGCGMSETLNADTSAVYQPVSSAFEAISIYANEGGTLHKLLGARGTVSFVFNKDSIPVMRFSFIGRWTIPAAAALAGLTLTGWQNGIPVGKVNTPTFTLDGFEAELEQLQIDLGNSVIHRDRPNAEYVAITGRQAGGSMQVAAPALGTKNLFTTAVTDALVARQIIHGTVAGNIVQIDEPKVQLLQPSYADSDGIRLLSCNTQSNRDAGDDEIVVTVM